ncbi:hypothetical protein RI367_006202 [Sorochytrium milnesiophthora]
MFAQMQARQGDRVRGSDRHIMQRRKDDLERGKLQAELDMDHKEHIQREFEHSSEKAIRRNNVRRGVERNRQQYEADLEERRQRLRELYDADAARYRQQLQSMEHTNESRIDSMRVRVAELKAKREAERQAIVAEKLQQQKRANCDELRALSSKMFTEQVIASRHEQLEEKEASRQLQRLEKERYDAEWEAERQKKVAREQHEQHQRSELNRTTQRALDEQVAQLKLNKAREAELKVAEGVLMRQKHELDQLAEQRHNMAKREEARQLRRELEQVNKALLEQRSREVQEALQEDLRLVQEFARMDMQERDENNRKKAVLREELQNYKAYIEHQQAIEIERRRELDVAYRAEEERVWQLRTERWLKEQAGRDKLMAEVIAVRQEQLRYKLEQNRAQQEQAKLDLEELQKQIAATKQQELLERSKLKESQQGYNATLKTQVADNQARRAARGAASAAEAAARKLEQEQYQEWLQEELKRPVSGFPGSRAHAKGSTRGV